MGAVGNSGNSVNLNTKAESVEKKTTLDKGVEVIQEKTKKGTLVGDHYVMVGAGTLVGGVATVAAVAKLADKVPAIDKAIDLTFNKATAGAVAIASSVILAEDAVQSFKEGSTVKGGAEALGSAVAGLGGVELVGRKFNIPVANRALTATGEFIGKNSPTIIGSGAAIGGGVAIKSGIDDISEGKKVKGGLKVAGGAVGLLGGAELIGRQHGIKYMDQALTGPLKAVFTSKGGLAVSGAAVAAAGAGAGIDGVRRLTTGKGILNDAIGVAEVTAATTAITGGTSLIGVAVGNEAMKKVFTQNADVIGAVALTSGAVALGKHTAKSLKENGVGYVNAATATGAGLAAAGAVSIVGEKVGLRVAEKAFEKSWQPVLATGLGMVSYKLGSTAVKEMKEGSAVNALGAGAGAVVTGAASVAIVGNAFKIPGLEHFGGKILETAGDIASPVFEAAVKHPFVTLGVVATAGAVGAYTYYNKNDAEKETKKAEAK